MSFFSLSTAFLADFQAKIQQNANFDQTLNDQVDEILAEDLYYLLQSFSAMVLARKKCDWDFIVHVTIDLLKIGFINEFTKDICYKTVKDLLSNITAKHPETISIILVKMKENLRDVSAEISVI
jgi:ectopic P granules protein 5